MRIGFFTDSYSQINGVTVTIKALEKQLRKMGHEVYVYAPRGEAGEDINNPYLFTSEGFRFILSPEYRWAVFPIFTIPRSNLGLDIIHVHSPVSMGLAGLINARRLAIPCVASIHTLLPEFWKPFVEKYLPYFTPPFFNRAIKRLLKTFDRFSLVGTSIDLGTFFMEELSWRYFAQFFKHCDIAFVPSKYAQEECQKHGLKTGVMPNGIDFSKFTFATDHTTFNQQWNLEAQERLLLYVGRLSEEKNIQFILESAPGMLKMADRLKIMIVGDGPHRTKLEKIVARNNITESVIFTGYLHQNALNQAYSRADVFINASPLETQGLSVIEAMYFGCPILTINGGAVAEIVRESDSGLIFDDRTSLIHLVRDLLSDSKILKKYGANAREKSKEYDIKEYTNRLLALYDDLLSKRNKRNSNY